MSLGSISYGLHQCSCCCGHATIHTDYDCDRSFMRCVACRCSRRIPAETPQAKVQIRLVHIGSQTLATMRFLNQLAELLGAQEDAKYVSASTTETYIEIDTEGIRQRLEIEEVRKVLQGAK